MYKNNLWRAIVALLTSKSLKLLLLNIDRLGNAISGGNYDATISGRIGWFAKYNGNKYWLFLQYIVDKTFLPIDGENHCLHAYESEKKIKHRRGNDIALFFLLIIVVFVCTFILIPAINIISIFKKRWD